jgi:hypothetical protein
VAQGVGPEFKPQYCQKKKKKSLSHNISRSPRCRTPGPQQEPWHPKVELCGPDLPFPEICWRLLIVVWLYFVLGKEGLAENPFIPIDCTPTPTPPLSPPSKKCLEVGFTGQCLGGAQCPVLGFEGCSIFSGSVLEDFTR